jgi:hypothetical protein
VIGFLTVAADLLHEVIVIFSDMRRSVPPPDIAPPDSCPPPRHCGVHAAGKDIAYWQSLRAFWEGYFAKAGATLKGFSHDVRYSRRMGRTSACRSEMNGCLKNRYGSCGGS